MKLAALAAALVAVATAETCDYAVVGPTLQSLGKPIASCLTATDNSYNLARATEPPTAEQAAAICAKCQDFVAAVTAITWPECTMNVGGSEQTLTSYFDKMIGGCKDGSSTSSTTTTLAATTAAPASAGSGSGEADSAAVGSQANTTDDSVTTAPTSSTPVPSPTSAGYSIEVGVVAASAVAMTMAIVF